MNCSPEINGHYSQFGLWTEEQLGNLMSAAAYRWPDRELICINGKRFSYAQIASWEIAVAKDLVASGVRPGDRVMLHLNNCIELLVLQLATWRIGAVSVPVVPIYRVHELRHILQDSRPHVLVALQRYGERNPIAEFDAMFASGVPEPAVKIVVNADGHIEGWRPPQPIPDETTLLSDENLPAPAAADATSLILYTSGTTSAPKGAMLSGRALLSNADNWRLTLNLSPTDVAFSGAPLAHIAALCSAFLTPLRLGGRTVILSAWNADRAIEAIVSEGCTYMAGATVFLQDLVQRCEAGASLQSQLMFVSGGAATSPDLVMRAERHGIKACRAWGMTETAGTCTLASRESPLEKRANFDGRAVFGTTIKVVNDDGQPVPYGVDGHVLVRSPQMMQGYTDARISAEQLDDLGWFRTGDIGSVTADGWFRMSGRVKDIINRGGEKFSAADIENALVACSQILSAAVVGAPHPRFGECVAAFLVLRDGCEWSGPEAVIAQLENAGLARSKIPTQWTIVPALPMTATGKVQKQKLLDMLAAQQTV